MTRRRRGLSDEERTLWATVARTAVPLRPGEAVEPETPPAPPEPDAAQFASVPPAEPQGPAGARPKPSVPPLSPIERRVLSRVARGMVGIDGRIDLHGMTQHDAHLALRAFLVSAQMRGAKTVLVITGKGFRESRAEPHLAHANLHAAHFGEQERGVLRRRVPQWLAEPGLRDIVLGFDEAHRSHGGGGALYVRLRRRRETPR